MDVTEIFETSSLQSSKLIVERITFNLVRLNQNDSAWRAYQTRVTISSELCNNSVISKTIETRTHNKTTLNCFLVSLSYRAELNDVSHNDVKS